MTRPITLPNNLPSGSSPWGRQVTDSVNNLATDVDRFKANQTNLNRANNANIQSLVTNGKAVADQITYLNGLTVIGDTGVTFDLPSTPGDSTFRYYESSPSLKIVTNCPTGRLMLTYGSGESRVDAGNSSASASVSFRLSTPSGWTYTPTTDRARMTVFNAQYMAVPLAATTFVTDIPTDEPVTVTIRYGVWSTATSAKPATFHFTGNYVTAQVV